MICGMSMLNLEENDPILFYKEKLTVESSVVFHKEAVF